VCLGAGPMSDSAERRPRPSGADAWRGISHAVIEKSGGVSGMLIAAIPTIVFVTVNSLASLHLAIWCVGGAGALVVSWQLIRRRPLRQAWGGLAVAGVCGGVAAYTGDAKAFFVIPLLVPLVAAVACVVSVLAGTPLTGVLFNRLVGGPPAWRRNRRLRAIYTATTLLLAVLNVISFALQAEMYRANQIPWLAAFHILTGPVRPVVIVLTVILARRTVARGPAFGC
jgi:hypothetical protein